MSRIHLVAIFALLMVAAPAAAQNPTARAEQLAADFTKVKSSTKTKHNTTWHKYKEIISEAWIASARDYAGRYLSEEPFLEIRIDGPTAITVAGRDPQRFEVRDARIMNGLLTGTKQYADGRTAPFEAVFLKRSDRSAPDQTPVVVYGIGMLIDPAPSGVGSMLRVFAARQ